MPPRGNQSTKGAKRNLMIMQNYIYHRLVSLANFIAVTFNLQVSIFDEVASWFEPIEKADPRASNVR